MFYRGSRYEKVKTLRYVGPDGRVAPYKDRRILPRPEAAAAHVVDAGDRPDHIAYRYYREPEHYWYVADSNVVMDPRELTDTPGRAVSIPAPGG